MRLWIAFKNLYLCSLKQRSVEHRLIFLSCELLSKTCIFALWNNQRGQRHWQHRVVNCFQKLVSLLFETTGWVNTDSIHALWIAFKNLYLCSLKQPSVEFLPILPGCELLSKTCIFALWNNFVFRICFGLFVVNCFQKLVSLLFETTLPVAS